MRTQELFKPYEANPILKPEDLPYLVNAVFNPGATVVSGRTVLLARVEDRTGSSHFNTVVLEDGKKVLSIDPTPTLLPDQNLQENLGIEDARIVFFEELKQYVISYTSYYETGGVRGYRISLMTTDNRFQNFKRLGPILFPGDKDAALFPKKINGLFTIIHRPEILGRAEMWISSSPDLKYWGGSQILLKTRGGKWDQDRIGLNTPPIETPHGWLIIYHGVVKNVAVSLYRIGLVLLDLKEPRKVLHRTPDWVLGSTESFFQGGDVPGAIFPCGAVLDKETNQLRLYCGVGDKSIHLYEADMDEIMIYIRSCPSV